MNLQVEQVDKDLVHNFKIIGEIDIYTAPKLKEHLANLEQAAGMEVELDLSEVNYMDSTGLGVFVGFYKEVKANNGSLVIKGLNQRLYRLFEITGLSDIMEIEQSKGGEDNAGV
ncbi:anti-anti-sigma factor [Sporosarcina sp. P37]|uniref:STAS domain-containing protein n=1 Tax=unclassified Sporosarcina TaxID=2647733 RepID=UPI0009C03935|nr:MULTISPECIES: STAS domain-containing protein [unclassified Sporosarcina]ARD48009.1 anti-anti-sigma factor [Sporosarcina sp. P33]ARK24525.1 anti-anti-sigma factor [Sporosarcina sp. P37]PID19681.1 anti-sigma factor antagonist [Sporosarcina sp. P35]